MNLPSFPQLSHVPIITIDSDPLPVIKDLSRSILFDLGLPGIGKHLQMLCSKQRCVHAWGVQVRLEQCLLQSLQR